MTARVPDRSFDAARLTLARHRAGLTKRDVASAVGVTPTAVGQYESGSARPGPAVQARLADAVGMPADYFAAGRAVLAPDPEGVHFRTVRSTRPAERRQALATLAHLAEITNIVERVVRLPPVDLPAPAGPGVEPTAAARAVRSAWGCGAGPVAHLVRRLEAKGCVVAVADFPSASRIDGFSCWLARPARPVIFLSADRNDAYRRRMSAAHELGHLLMHPAASPGDQAHEQQAEQFAEELLLPSTSLDHALPRGLDLAAYYELERAWGVPVDVVLRRARETGRLAPAEHRAARRLHEDGSALLPPAPDLPGEWPAVLSRALDTVRGRGLDADALAAGLRLPVHDVSDLLGTVDGRPEVLAGV